MIINRRGCFRCCNPGFNIIGTSLHITSARNREQRSLSQLSRQIPCRSPGMCIRWPQDGRFFGDFNIGEKLAQDGRGNTWSDKPGTDNGGNCYNCHQITQEEISYGTIGPSLYHYGKIRGVTDPNSAAAKPIVEYTWGKIWNAKAYNACSNMPRAGHMGILNQEQVRHIVALLLDPQSPVNK